MSWCGRTPHVGRLSFSKDCRPSSPARHRRGGHQTERVKDRAARPSRWCPKVRGPHQSFTVYQKCSVNGFTDAVRYGCLWRFDPVGAVPFLFMFTRHKISATPIQPAPEPKKKRKTDTPSETRSSTFLLLRCYEHQCPVRHDAVAVRKYPLRWVLPSGRLTDVPDDALQFDHVLLGQLGMLQSSTQTDPEPCCAALPRISDTSSPTGRPVPPWPSKRLLPSQFAHHLLDVVVLRKVIQGQLDLPLWPLRSRNRNLFFGRSNIPFGT